METAASRQNSTRPIDRRLLRYQNIGELTAGARRRLPKVVFDLVDGAAEDEFTARQNIAAFKSIAFRPHVLVDVEHRDLSTTILGQPLSLPVIFGPAGSQGLVNRCGESAAAAAANEAGTVYTLSFASTHPIERVRSATLGPLWQQLSIWKDRSLSESIMERAIKAQYSALCLTVDVVVGANREHDTRNGLTRPFRITRRNALSVAAHPGWYPTAYAKLRHESGNFESKSVLQMVDWVSQTMNAAATWEEIEWYRKVWPGKLLLKGIMRSDDTIRARDSGADGIVVSNHGGRQLDGAMASIDALPSIAKAVGSDIDVLVDGGIRRGADVVKAIASGAKAVMVARPYVLSLAYGPDGPRRVLEILRKEIDTTMALLGAPNLQGIDPSMIETVPYR